MTASVHEDASKLISSSATAAAGAETGGVLLGWWDDGDVVIRFATEVPDPDATSTSWTRDEACAQRVLDAELRRHRHPWLGYVGDWHTHPAACAPSPQDERSIRRASLGYEHPLVLLVHRADERLDARAAHRGRLRPVTVTTLEP